MSVPVWDQLLNEVRAVHARHPDLQAFCPFPATITPQDMIPQHDPLCDRLVADDALTTTPDYAPFRDALKDAAGAAQWRETYKHTDYGETFHANFGCYEILGVSTPHGVDSMRSFVIYQKPGFLYPWHHHPAEELYLVVAGEGEFHIEGETSRHLKPGDTAYHASNVPHALTTGDTPILAYVLWRGDLQSPPVWTYPDKLR